MSSFPSENGEFRFLVGDKVWVRDLGRNGRGYKIEEATVREQHYHPDRHPAYPHGEGYALDVEYSQLEPRLWRRECQTLETTHEIHRGVFGHHRRRGRLSIRGRVQRRNDVPT